MGILHDFLIKKVKLFTHLNFLHREEMKQYDSDMLMRQLHFVLLKNNLFTIKGFHRNCFIIISEIMKYLVEK